MAMPAEVIAHAIRATSSPEKAAEWIVEYEKRRDQVNQRNLQAEWIVADARERVAALMKEPLCAHEVRKRHADPSGGSDSHETCLICGEIITHKEARFT